MQFCSAVRSCHHCVGLLIWCASRFSGGAWIAIGGDAVFDPYYKWLGIRPEHQPPDHYRLLGLDTFESDTDVIQSAAERQMAHIQSYKIGPQSDLSQRILNEIAKAKVCLLNPAKKSDYDRGLHQRSAPPAIQPTVAAPPISEPDPVAPEVAIARDVAMVPPLRFVPRMRSAPRRQRGPSTALMLGSVGLLLVILTTTVFYNRERFRKESPAVEATSSAGQPSTRPESPSNVNDDSMASSAVLPGNLRRKKPTVATPEKRDASLRTSPPEAQQAAATREPKPGLPAVTPEIAPTRFGARPRVPSPAAIQQTRKTIDNVTAMVDLPDRDNTQPIPIPVHGAVSFVDVLTPAVLNPLVFSVEPDDDGLSWTISDDKRAVARVRSGNGLTIAWEVDAHDRADSLRNALLIVHGDSQPIAIALRRTIEVASPKIELASGIAKVPINAPLWGLQPLDLRLEAVGIDRIQLDKRFPEDGRASHGDPAQIVIRDVLPKAGIELSLNGRNPLYVRMKPILETFDHKLKPWSNGNVKSLGEECAREIDNCNERIQFLTANIPTIENELADLKQRNRSNAAIAAQIAAVTANLKSAKSELEQLRSHLPAIEQMRSDSQQLLEVSQQIHQAASITFRVYYSVGKCDVAIVQASPKTD